MLRLKIRERRRLSLVKPTRSALDSVSMKSLIKMAIPSFLIPLSFGLLSIGFLPKAHAISPPPDGGYPGGNTAEGTDALFSRTTGINNTAVGSQALFHDTSAGFNRRGRRPS